MAESQANHDAYRNLARVIQSERPLALVGAGCSVPAGYPTWDGLLSLLEKRLPPLTPKYLGFLRKETDTLWRAEEYRNYIAEAEYRQFLSDTFAPKPEANIDTARALVRLNFGHVLTTNYDPVLEHAFAREGKPMPETLNWADDDDVRKLICSVHSPSPQMLMYLHGKYDRPRSIVLTERDYTERYVRNDDTVRKLFAVFATQRVVFIGFSLEDPDLMTLLREVNASIRAMPPRHFAILALRDDQDDRLIRNRLRGRFGIEPVFFRYTKDYALLQTLLRHLAEQDTVTGHIEKEAEDLLTLEDGVVFSDDPQKGRWGGKPVANGRKLSAKVSGKDGWFRTVLEVRATTKKNPLRGTVKFHLHDTFPDPVLTVPVRNGVARESIWSYGAFTVGAETDGGATKLELDLAELPDAPKEFRES